MKRIIMLAGAVLLWWATPAQALPITDAFSVSLYLTPNSADLYYYEGFGGLTPGIVVTAETLLRGVFHVGDVIETVTFEALLQVLVTEAPSGAGYTGDPPLAGTPEPATLLLLGTVLAGLGWRLRRGR